MPKKNGDIVIKKAKSGLAEFTRHSMPSEQEVEEFDHYVENEIREKEIKDSLAEIYQDDEGKMVNVKKLDIKKGHGFWFWFFVAIFMSAVLSTASYFGYRYYKFNLGKSSIDFSISADQNIIAGKEFTYTINYKNSENVGMNKVEIKATYPENFIFIESDPKPDQNDNIWKINSIGPHRSDSIKIKGKLIGEVGKANIMLADMSYTPSNFSSEFKKSASLESAVSGVGFDITLENTNTALIGETNEIKFKYKAQPESYIKDFRLSVSQADNLEFLTSGVATSTDTVTDKITEDLKNGIWQIANVGQGEKELTIKFKIKEKKTDRQEITVKLETVAATSTSQVMAPTDKFLPFYQKIITYDVIKSDLSLNLIINGSATDQGADFGQRLNYSISFENKGETEMKDVAIMAVLESDFLNWQTLDDKNNGKQNGNTITWTKQEIPALASLKKNDQGTIDFSIKIKDQNSIDFSKNYQVKSYIQYNVGDTKPGDDNRSNIIINKINSDLKLNEQIRYFNDDNIAVGSGPLPPVVGQSTSFKVYWSIDNNLHDLDNLEVVANLPGNVKWNEKNRASIGTLNYDSQANKVTWQIGRLPVSYKADAEFNISFTPTVVDRNKIAVLLPGTEVSANDMETGSQIKKTMKAKTTKLDDDSIANSDGIVQ